ncbi:MAG: alpha/beta hydrolase [Candidatus Eremiobacteraeota bacterium]|nr:alpha/beta hydrolase [Candidatus Eremiobacteraeota bacterium]
MKLRHRRCEALIGGYARVLTAAACFAAAAAPVHSQAATVAPQPKAVDSFDSGILHVDQYGSGPKTLVFIPGLASGTWSWYEQIAKFSPSYTIYAIELPGFNGRPAAAQTNLFDTFSHDFFSMLVERRIVKPVVIGHSLGGTLAILLAERRANALSGIVAVDGLPVFPTAAQSTAQERKALADRMAATIAGMDHDQMLAGQRQYMRAIGTTDGSFAAQLASLTAKSDSNAVAAWMREDLESDLRPDLANITIPFLEIMPYAAPSPYSQRDTLSFYRMLLNGAPHVEIVPISPARHYVMLDQPQQFDDALTRFLSTLQ